MICAYNKIGNGKKLINKGINYIYSTSKKDNIITNSEKNSIVKYNRFY